MNPPTPPQQPPENNTPEPATETQTPDAPEVLNLALSQIAKVLKTSGTDRLTALADEGGGYAKVIALLEKVSKASLDWREQQQATERNTDPKPGGISEETQRQFERMLGER